MSLPPLETALPKSPTMLNARLSFLDTRLALIHIPSEVVDLFIQPILRLLIHINRHDDFGEAWTPSRPWMFWHPFVHVSFTPDCFVVCPRQEANAFFRPIVGRLDASAKRATLISQDDFAAILISGEGLDASQRVLDLTAPLATAGISIRFITSYYADFILVPFPARSKVIRVLEECGFMFEAHSQGDAGEMTNAASPVLYPGRHDSSHGAPSIDLPSSARRSSMLESAALQQQTLKTLQQHQITPSVDSAVELVTCAGIKESMASTSAINNAEGKLQLGIAKCLTCSPPARFLAITLTDSESVSFTLEKRLLTHFHNEGENLLLGRDGPEQIAITFDLKNQPEEITGIVCGIATALKAGMAGRAGDLFNLSYLSTTHAGHVIVYKDELDDAVKALDGFQIT